MHRYLVRFMKRVLGENGHEVEICQRWIEVQAANEPDAIRVAKTQFCLAENIANWDRHADRIEIAEADFAS
jgi:hypothetical protein